MTFVAELDPKTLWRHFDQILQIPRASKEEGRMRDYVVGIAERLGLDHSVDATGNVVVHKPASAGREGAPATILQSHLDMVQEKNSDVDFDFGSDAIRPVVDGDYLTADGTTLGSDNGVGVAAMLAVAEAEDLEHGPLELLFTVDEETGLTGAAGLDPKMLSAKRLINLDSEEDTLTVGCAGGADATLGLPVPSAPVEAGSVALEVTLSGLKGGHSGVDIHLQRGNAIQLLARALWAAAELSAIRLAAFGGGSAHNAIPREARALAVVPAADRKKVVETVRAELEGIAAEFRAAEPDLTFSVEPAETPAEAWEAEAGWTALELVVGLPHGVQGWSYDIPELVETSTNLATVRADGDRLTISTSSRSSVATALTALNRKIYALGRLAGAKITFGDGYPGWQPDLDSDLLGVVQGVHRRVVGSAPKVEAIHAGLECGLIGEMIPGMDMISFGPQIEFPHSPDERVHVESVGRFWELLTETLDEISKPA